jgi:hypothetical protein
MKMQGVWEMRGPSEGWDPDLKFCHSFYLRFCAIMLSTSQLATKMNFSEFCWKFGRHIGKARLTLGAAVKT